MRKVTTSSREVQNIFSLHRLLSILNSLPLLCWEGRSNEPKSLFISAMYGNTGYTRKDELVVGFVGIVVVI